MWPFRASKKIVKPEFFGVPRVRRVKNYAAETGHTYRYSYRGWRSTSLGDAEHSFEFRRDNAAPATLHVRLLQSCVDACAAEIGRELISSERYAIVKLALFRELDDSADPATSYPIVPTASDMVEFLRRLGRI